MSAHGYAVARAREILSRAGGDPDNAGPLAQWAEAARDGNNDVGVLVAEDGRVLAEYTVVTDSVSGLRASYITAEDTQRWNLWPNEVGLAVAQLVGQLGMGVIQVSRADVCQGPSRPVAANPPPMTRIEVAALRHMVGLSAAAFGDALGVNPRTVRGWESGSYTPGHGPAAAMRELLAEHTADMDRLSADGEPPEGTARPHGWWVAAAARMQDREARS